MNVLIIPGITMPDVGEALVDRIVAAGGPDTRVVIAESPGEALEAVEDVEVILGPVDRQLFERAKRLRWVHAITAGADAYLFDEMMTSEVVISGDKGLVGSHLADHAFGLLLALTRRIGRALVDGPVSWERRAEYRREEFELEGLTMGVIGFGGTGASIAQRAAGFDMRCIAVDSDPVEPTAAVPEVWGLDRFDELLETSDVVASGLPLTPDTREIFGRRTFQLMKPSAILVNVTRGELIDGEALVEAINEGQIAGAALDVAPQEPLPPDHPLWTTPNVVMTPHTAGASQYRIGRNMDRFCRNIERFRNGEPLEGQIDKHRGF